jgi:hypothetical protein
LLNSILDGCRSKLRAVRRQHIEKQPAHPAARSLSTTYGIFDPNLMEAWMAEDNMRLLTSAFCSQKRIARMIPNTLDHF